MPVGAVGATLPLTITELNVILFMVTMFSFAVPIEPANDYKKLL